jgi:serpin B
MTTTTARDANTFASRLYHKLAQSQTGNVFLSPYSVQVALGMCLAGARGETRRVLSELLSVPEERNEQLHLFEDLLREVHGHGSARDYELITANALWMHKSYPSIRDYVETVKKSFHGSLNLVDYRTAPDDAVQQINAWVDENTRHKIPTIISRDLIDDDTRLVLTNAIYFKGLWHKAFNKEDTRQDTWHNGNTHYPTWMMHNLGAYRYHENPAFKALELPYKGDDLAMLLLLPNETHTLAEIDLTPSLYQQVVQRLAWEEKVAVKLPRFKVETKYTLAGKLKEMGAALAFRAGADFTGIGPGGLSISEVIHKAFVEVNEEGTEAAAATMVKMVLEACIRPEPEPKEFFCTRPFLFLIRNVKTNTVLFAGRLVEAPKA